jgi:hypothetical protein
MGRISRSIELAKSSWHVLKADKELLALPVISGLASMVVAATFIIPLVSTGTLDTENTSPVSWVFMFLMYVALAYVTIFFNSALVHAANERMEGGDPTIGSAIAGASSRAGKILPWAIVSATVSVILRAIEERAGVVGQIVSGLAGLAWAVVTFLVLPIIVIEGISVGDAIKKSSELFKRTWGENLAAQIGFGLLGFVTALPAIALIFLGVAGGSGTTIAAIVVAVAWLILVAVTIAALSVIFQTALYHYAVTGEVPGGFSADVMRSAFGPTKGRR